MSSFLVLVEFKILKPKLPQKGIGVTYRNQSVQMLCIFQPIKVAIEENQIKWPIVVSLDIFAAKNTPSKDHRNPKEDK